MYGMQWLSVDMKKATKQVWAEKNIKKGRVSEERQAEGLWSMSKEHGKK